MSARPFESTELKEHPLEKSRELAVQVDGIVMLPESASCPEVPLVGTRHMGVLLQHARRCYTFAIAHNDEYHVNFTCFARTTTSS